MGFDFLLYKKGPQYTHAAFCVWIVRKDQVIQPRILAGKVRVAASVKKVCILMLFIWIKYSEEYLSCRMFI